MTTWKAVTFILIALVSAACGRRESVQPRAIIQDRHSDKPIVRAEQRTDVLAVDFRSPLAMTQVDFVAATAEHSGDFVRVHPESNDPLIAFGRRTFSANTVEIEMRTRATGNIEVFWTPAGEEFDEAHKKRLPFTPDDTFKIYSFDLTSDMDLTRGEYRFRVDPVDSQSEFDVRSMRLSRVTRPPQTQRPGKARFGQESREAFALRAEGNVVFPIDGDVAGELAFAVRPDHGNHGTVHVTASLGCKDGVARPVAKVSVGADSSKAWTHFRRVLGSRCSNARITFSATSHGRTTDDFVLIANPTIGRPVAHDIPNVVLISIDTLGKSHLDGVDHSPRAEFLHQLAKEGVSFGRAYSTSGLTHISHASILTGLPPMSLPREFFGAGTIGTTRTLADALRRAGYQTAAFTGGVLIGHEFGFDRGFQTFHQTDTLYHWPKTDIEKVTALALDWLATADREPFFLFLHTYEVHGPFRTRGHLDTRRSDGVRSTDISGMNFVHMRDKKPVDLTALGPYVEVLNRSNTPMRRKGISVLASDIDYAHALHDGEIDYVDDELRQFFHALSRKKLLDNTLVVVTADHGEAFHEHGLLQHGLLYDENLHVPLILWWPRRLRPAVIAEPVSNSDVAATVLALVESGVPEPCPGRPLPIDGGVGRNGVRPLSEAFVPGSGFAWRNARLEKMIQYTAPTSERFGETELFDLSKDVGEKANLAAAGIPRSLQALMLRSRSQVPGLHLSVAELNGQVLRFRIRGAPDELERLMVFGLEVEHGSRNVEKNRVTFAGRATEGTEIVLVGGGGGTVSVDLFTTAHRLLASVTLQDHSTLPRAIPVGNGKLIRLFSTTPSVGPAKSVDEEHVRKLRSIGYVR